MAYDAVVILFKHDYLNSHYGICPKRPPSYATNAVFRYARTFIKWRSGKVISYSTFKRYERDYRRQLVLEWESLPVKERVIRKLVWELKRKYYRFSDLKELPNRFRNLTKMTND